MPVSPSMEQLLPGLGTRGCPPAQPHASTQGSGAGGTPPSSSAFWEAQPVELDKTHLGNRGTAGASRGPALKLLLASPWLGPSTTSSGTKCPPPAPGAGPTGASSLGTAGTQAARLSLAHPKIQALPCVHPAQPLCLPKAEPGGGLFYFFIFLFLIYYYFPRRGGGRGRSNSFSRVLLSPVIHSAPFSIQPMESEGLGAAGLG